MAENRKTSDEKIAFKPEELDPSQLDTTFLIQLFIATLATKSWQSMGLVQDPATKEFKKDITSARLAIDAIGALIPVVESHIPPDQAKQLRVLLADLRLNFVRQFNSSSTTT